MAAEVSRRRFTPPWTVEETQACFVVKDHHGQKLEYVYFEDEPGRQAAADLLTPTKPACAATPHWRAPGGERYWETYNR